MKWLFKINHLKCNTFTYMCLVCNAKCMHACMCCVRAFTSGFFQVYISYTEGRWKPKVTDKKTWWSCGGQVKAKCKQSKRHGEVVKGTWKPKVNSQKDKMKLSGRLRGQVEVKGLTHKEPNPYLCSEVVRVDVQVWCAVDPSVIWILNTQETCQTFSNMPTQNQSTNSCPKRLP